MVLRIHCIVLLLMKRKREEKTTFYSHVLSPFEHRLQQTRFVLCKGDVFVSFATQGSRWEEKWKGLGRGTKPSAAAADALQLSLGWVWLCFRLVLFLFGFASGW